MKDHKESIMNQAVRIGNVIIGGDAAPTNVLTAVCQGFEAGLQA